MGSRNGHPSGKDNHSETKQKTKAGTLGWGEEITRKFSVAAFGSSHLVGSGPSIRQRARLAIFSAFILALLALGVGVMRTSTAVQNANTFVLYDKCGDAIRRIQGDVSGVEAAAWRYQARPGFDNERRLQNSFDGISRRVVTLIQSSQGKGNEEDLLCVPFNLK